MSIKFTKLSQILIITTIASMCSIEVIAENHSEGTSPSVSLNQAFNDAYFTHAKNAYEQSGYWGQTNTIFGFIGFPEQQIARDARAVHSIYQDAMKQQAEVGLPIMTKDLVNPYNTSLLENPDYIGIK